MTEQTFAGRIEVDIRDSTPDWSPFEPPKALAGAPNALGQRIEPGQHPHLERIEQPPPDTQILQREPARNDIDE
jgi:hypothetical protein